MTGQSAAISTMSASISSKPPWSSKKGQIANPISGVAVATRPGTAAAGAGGAASRRPTFIAATALRRCGFGTRQLMGMLPWVAPR
jgi:hypothetical protein